MIEDENHVLKRCDKSPFRKIGNNYNFKEVVFEGQQWDPQLLDQFSKDVFKTTTIFKIPLSPKVCKTPIQNNNMGS